VSCFSFERAALSDKLSGAEKRARAVCSTRLALTPTTESNHLVEAISSLALSRAQRQAQAVRVLAMHTAKREVKEQLRSQGIKVSRVPAREITAMATAKVMDDGEYRERLIAEARPIVDQWTAEGFFGKRAAQRQLE
jgi:hypothetical protein